MTKIRDYPNDSLLFAEGPAPATPAVGQVRIYADASGAMFAIDDAGVSVPLSGGGGGGSSPVGSPSATVAASRSLDAGDAGAFLYCDHASTPIVITVPTDAGITIPLDAEIHLRRQGVAAVSVLAGAGVTVTKPAGQVLALNQRYSVATLKRKTATEWALFGDLGAAP